MDKKIFNVVGNSMQPLIFENDKVEVQKLNSEDELKQFDIIVFKQDGRLLVHYFWRKNSFLGQDGRNIITRPLNPIQGFDHPIGFSQIVGRVENFRVTRWLRLKVYASFFFISST